MELLSEMCNSWASLFIITSVVSSVATIQGLYGSWKTWKVLEFYCGIFQDWKKATGPGKFWKSVQLNYIGKNIKCMEDSKEN